ncbi:translation initiation factor IF-2-like [Panicum virgatum]|uniref:translation initiation factor IF-2-like n=1 Tax=Panicum virgatum TaxID=38727 RepID=UPI0019D6799F|nr:translation initiation factor IF-2-like [Panicum virgatum]
MPESTDEEDTSDAEVNLPGDDEAATGTDSPPVYQEAGDEDAPLTLREARPTPGLLVDPPLAGAERRSPTPAARGRSPTPAAGGRSSTPVTERRLPLPAVGEGVPAPAMSTSGDGSAASAETPAQMASRLQADPRTTPSNQSSRGVSVPRARRSGTGKRSMSARSGSGAVAKDAAPLAPAKALKTGARVTPHMAPQPPPIVDIVAEAAKLREAMTRGAQVAQQARAPGNGGDASQGGIEAASQADAVGEAGRGDADDATRPDVEVEAGRSDADSAARLVAEEGAGRNKLLRTV